MIESIRNLGKYDIDYMPTQVVSEKFTTMRQAVSQIENGRTVMTAGFGGHGKASYFFQAVKEEYLKTGRPANLNWLTVSGQGNRGKGSGSIEDLAIPGLIKRYITGFHDSSPKLLALGEIGEIELHTLPQGQITDLLLAQAEKKTTVETQTGIGTFLDPGLGGSSALTPHTDKSYVSKVNGNIVYTMPKVEVAAFYAPYADSEGNIYYKHASCLSECTEIAMAARTNGGKVIVFVSDIIEKNAAEISISHEHVTSVSVNPLADQQLFFPQKKYFKALTAGANEDPKAALEKIQFINSLVGTLLGAIPKRTPIMYAMARKAAAIVTKVCKVPQKSILVNFGIGLPEEVSAMLYRGGVSDRFTFTAEAGAYGGIPTAGAFFGGAINPKELKSSAWMFNHYKENLDLTVLGIMQVDSEGNVNVSRRGKKVTQYVGCGGFIDISTAAKNIIFIGTFMAKAELKLKKGRLTVKKKGIPKFVDQLMEVTFPAKEALKQGKEVHYVTDLGVFRLTEKGLLLTEVMPGIDIQKDIIQNAKAKIHVADHVETITPAFVTGKNFNLKNG